MSGITRAHMTNVVLALSSDVLEINDATKGLTMDQSDLRHQWHHPD